MDWNLSPGSLKSVNTGNQFQWASGAPAMEIRVANLEAPTRKPPGVHPHQLDVRGAGRIVALDTHYCMDHPFAPCRRQNLGQHFPGDDRPIRMGRVIGRSNAYGPCLKFMRVHGFSPSAWEPAT